MIPPDASRYRYSSIDVVLRVVFILATVLQLGVNQLRAQRTDPTLNDDLVRLETIYDTVRSGGARSGVLEEIADLKLRVTARPLPAVAERQQRKQLARAWKLVAAISRDVEGDTDLVLEYYRVAAGLDPEDTEVAAELAFRQRKFDAVNERLEEARRLRVAEGKKE